VREFLSARGVPFEDRNIRASEAARAELLDRTGRLVVPQLVWGDRVVVGFDPEALAEVVAAWRAGPV
jgi:glutaredoxin